MIKAPSAQCGQCLPSLVWPVSRNAERGSASFLPLSVTSRPFHWCKQDCAHLFSPESNEKWLFKQREIGLGRMRGSPRSQRLRVSLQRLLELSGADQRSERCRTKRSRQREPEPCSSSFLPSPLCFILTGFPSAPLQWQVAGSLPPQVLDMEFPLWGPFFSYLATRHHLLVSLWSQPTPHFVNEAFLKDNASHPRVSETHLTIPL